MGCGHDYFDANFFYSFVSLIIDVVVVVVGGGGVVVFLFIFFYVVLAFAFIKCVH